MSNIDLTHTIQHLPPAHYWLAYSGGMDSQVLLHILKHHLPQEKNTQLSAIHVNHGLHPEAAQWEQHCQSQCEQYNIPLCILKIDASSPAGESPEAYAREQRYAALTAQLRSNDVLLTAHHASDQAETLLLQLLRGAGVRGLAGMATETVNNQIKLLRPLLAYTREQLQQYAKTQKLTWVEDSSNRVLSYDRNFIRHQLMPLIETRWPKAVSTLNRSATHCMQAEQLLIDLAAMDYNLCAEKSTQRIHLKLFATLSGRRQRNLLRYWLQLQGIPMPDQRRLQQIQQQMLEARIDAQPQVHWGQAQVRRYRNYLYALTSAMQQQPSTELAWDLQQPLSLPCGIGYLTGQSTQGRGVCLPDTNAINVRFCHGGERCRLVNRAGERRLKKLWQEWGVPPWQRPRVPLIYHGDDLACIVGYGISSQFAANSQQTGWEFSLNIPNILQRAKFDSCHSYESTE